MPEDKVIDVIDGFSLKQYTEPNYNEDGDVLNYYIEFEDGCIQGEFQSLPVAIFGLKAIAHDYKRAIAFDVDAYAASSKAKAEKVAH